MVKDAANCSGKTSFSIWEPAPIAPLSLGVLNVSCAGGSNGQIFLTAFGGIGPYQFSNNGGAFTGIGLFSGLSGNTMYNVVIKDAQSCTVATSVYVDAPAPVVVIGHALNVKCAGGKSGSILLSVSGGVAPYNYMWSTGAAGPAIGELNGGVYTATVTDFNGCSSVHVYTISEAASPLILNGVITQATDPNTADGSIDLTVTGGVPPYSFTWSNGASTEDIGSLLSGAYLITVTDANGCTAASTFILGGPTAIGEAGNETLLIYPNPATDRVNIKGGNNMTFVSIRNLLGQTVVSSPVNGAAADLDVSRLANGQYFVTVESAGRPVTRRIVINR
jgi:hypothetical protein